MTPDVFVRVRDSGKTIAIELETDVQWDFGQSLHQIKKYRRNSRDFNLVVVIIPKEYVRFALLYRQENFPVYLWRASRVWECMQCGNIAVEERTVKPRCSVESCHSNEQRLKGLRDAFFEEFFPSPMGNKQ